MELATTISKTKGGYQFESLVETRQAKDTIVEGSYRVIVIVTAIIIVVIIIGFCHIDFC